MEGNSKQIIKHTFHKTKAGNLKSLDDKSKSPGSTALHKIDPSYKSKRYRDKLRTEIKALEDLLPVDRSTVHRKLDSQTVFRLSIGFFRMKLFLKAAGLSGSDPNNACMKSCASEMKMHTEKPSPESSSVNEIWETSESQFQAVDGYLMALTSDGTILYVSDNILQHLGFNQVDLIMRCIYGIIHPDDHQEMKVILEHTLNSKFPGDCGKNRECCMGDEAGQNAICRTVSFLCRMKCFNGTTTGYLKMNCTGHMRSFPFLTKSQRTSNQVLFAFCRPFLSASTDPTALTRCSGFWTKHDLDLHFKQMEAKLTESLGYEPSELEGTSFYKLLHPEDLVVFGNCHRALMRSEEVQTMYFRVQHKDQSWVWLHARGKVITKNSKKYSVIFTHCPVREEDSTYIQQEAILRQKYSISELMYGRPNDGLTTSFSAHHTTNDDGSYTYMYNGKDESVSTRLHDAHGQCPSSWHTAADRHSPVFPQHTLPHQPHQATKRPTTGSSITNHKDGYSPLMQNPYSQNYCNPLNFWNIPRHTGYEMNPGSMPETYDPYGSQSRKEYYMHFNGVGFASHDIGQYTPQYPSSTLFIQGHVTTFESDMRSGADAQYQRLPQLCQYPVCNPRDCLYGGLPYKGYCSTAGGDSLDGYGSHAQDMPIRTKPQCAVSQHHQTIKQEAVKEVVIPYNSEYTQMASCAGPDQTYPDLMPVSYIPDYFMVDRSAGNMQSSELQPL